MEAIRENPSIIQSEIAERVGKSVPTIKRTNVSGSQMPV